MTWTNSDTNLSIVNMYNQSNVSMGNVDSNEIYKDKAMKPKEIYIIIGITFGIIILLSNITVVISSGLILKKGQQPKSTYLLLGNVSLADTLFGLGLILRFSLEKLMIVDDTYCIFQIGLTTCPAMVSILSVGFIAVDRYIYILHGLYYHRWFTTAIIRFGILCTWIIGITLSFLPIVIAWMNKDHKRSRCPDIHLYPRELLLLNCLVVIIIIVVVGILYSIILVKAIKQIKKIKSHINTVDSKNSKIPEIRMKTRIDSLKKSPQAEKSYMIKIIKLNKSASFNGILNSNFNHSKELIKLSYKSKSVDDIYVNQLAHNTGLTFSKNNDVSNEFESEFSIQSISSVESYQMTSTINIETTENQNTRNLKCRKTRAIPKVKKEPNKWRAITVVMLTFGCFMFTCLPFYIKIIVDLFCKDKLDHPLCNNIKSAFGSAITFLSFVYNILNPLIYAWWHKGFQRSIKTYFRKYLQRYFR